MKKESKISLVECPRDAMQGWPTPINTTDKIGYIQSLLKVGFPILDMGSFVSPKAVPQMADTKEVLQAISLKETNTQLLVIVANERGCEEAVQQEKVSFIGYPFSISETFQQRNTGSSILQSLETVAKLQEKCTSTGKHLVVYISMAFGNPYGDKYDTEMVLEWVNKLKKIFVSHFSLADTVGLAKPNNVYDLAKQFKDSFQEVSMGLHLHASPHSWKEKFIAGLEAGCTQFDGAIGGIGGCPFAGSELVGNMNTLLMAEWLKAEGYSIGLDFVQLQQCAKEAGTIFNS
jgi:hydroxymethylglutaryl-CoA lyase